MATGIQVEELAAAISRGLPKQNREQVLTGLNNMGGGLGSLLSTKALLDTVVSDAATAEQNEYGYARIQADWAANLVSALGGWQYAGKSGVPALAQLIKDLSSQSGLEGGANQLRITAGGNPVAVD